MAVVHEAGSVAGWAEVLERVCFPLVVEQVRPGPFHATVTWIDLGPARIYHVRSGALAYRRNREQIHAASSHHFVLPIPSRSSIVRDQGGLEVITGPGEGSLGDSATPYRYVQTGGGDVLSLRIDGPSLLERVAAPATRTGVTLDLRAGSGRLITDLLARVWAFEAAASDEERRSAGHQVLDLVAFALEDRRPALREPAVRAALHGRVLRYVEVHLHDPELDPHAIAHALGVSIRYLHGLFEDHDTTLMRHVLRRRVEAAHAELSSGGPRHTVTEVAHRWGFRDGAHFSRSFRARFGYPPREAYARAGRPDDHGPEPSG